MSRRVFAEGPNKGVRVAGFVTADYLVFAAFLLAVTAAGFMARKAPKGALDYFIAGRAVTLPALVATLVATWYGGILAIGEFTYSYGVATWFVFGLPYYVFAIVFAFLLAPKVREAGVFSLSDRLYQVYGRRAAIMGGALTFILVSPAPYLLMMAVLLAKIFGIPNAWAMAVGAVVSTIYLYWGGLPADIRVNVVQFIAMYVGIGVIVPVAMMHYGGLDWLWSHLPGNHKTWTGGNTPWYIITWFFIALWTLVDPGFHQRSAAAHDPKVARRAILISVVLWFIFDLLTTTAGLYSRVILGDSIAGREADAFPDLADKILGPGLRGLFYVGMVATVMSTLVSYTFLAGVAFGRDVWWRARGETSEDRVKLYTRIGIFIATMVGVCLAIYFKSAVELWLVLGQCMIPGLLLPVVLSFFPSVRPSPWIARAMMLTGSVLSTGWFILTRVCGEGAMWDIQPMYPGLLATMLLWVAERLVAGRRARVAEAIP